MPALGRHPAFTLRPPAVGLCPSLLPVAVSAVTGTCRVHAPVQPSFDTASPSPTPPSWHPGHRAILVILSALARLVLRLPLSLLLPGPPGVSFFSCSLCMDGPQGICPRLTCSPGCFEYTGRLQLPPSYSGSQLSIPRPHPRPELGNSPGRYKHHRLKIGITQVPKPSPHASSLC